MVQLCFHQKNLQKKKFSLHVLKVFVEIVKPKCYNTAMLSVVYIYFQLWCIFVVFLQCNNSGYTLGTSMHDCPEDDNI